MSQMNLWTRYDLKCPIEHTFKALNMKRKAITLQHRQNALPLSKKEKFNLIVQGRYYNNKTPATDPASCAIGINHEDGSPASTNDVPGDKSFIIKDEIGIPIYNYIPVKRTYKGGANKYPYSTWSYGRAGFPVGSKGSSVASRAAAARELAANAALYSRLALTACNNIPCWGKSLKITVGPNSIYNHISVNKNPQAIPSELEWLEFPDYFPLYNSGGAWGAWGARGGDIIHIVSVQNHKWTYFFIYEKYIPGTRQLPLISSDLPLPFMALTIETLSYVVTNPTITFIPPLLTDCSNISENHQGITFTKNICSDRECYWWNPSNLIPEHAQTDTGYCPNISFATSSAIGTNKANYNITINCT